MSRRFSLPFQQALEGSKITQLLDRFRDRQAQPEAALPWMRSNDDSRHTAALVGLSAIVGGLVLTFFLAATHESSLSEALGGAFEGGVTPAGVPYIALDPHALDGTEGPSAAAGGRVDATGLPPSVLPIVSGDLFTSGTGPGPTFGPPPPAPGGNTPPGPSPSPGPSPGPSPSPEPSPAPEPSPSPRPSPSPEPPPSPEPEPSPEPTPTQEPPPEPTPTQEPPPEPSPTQEPSPTPPPPTSETGPTGPSA